MSAAAEHGRLPPAWRPRGHFRQQLKHLQPGMAATVGWADCGIQAPFNTESPPQCPFQQSCMPCRNSRNRPAVPTHPPTHLDSHGRALQVAQEHSALCTAAQLHKLPLIINNKLQAGAMWLGRDEGWKRLWAPASIAYGAFVPAASATSRVDASKLPKCTNPPKSTGQARWQTCSQQHEPAGQPTSKFPGERRSECVPSCQRPLLGTLLMQGSGAGLSLASSGRRSGDCALRCRGAPSAANAAAGSLACQASSALPSRALAGPCCRCCCCCTSVCSRCSSPHCCW